MNNPNIYGKRNGKSSLWKYLLFWLVIIILVITLVFTMSGRRREVVVWTHNDIKNYLTLEDNSETTNNDSEVQESLEAEYLARLKNIEEIKIQVGPYKTTFLMDYMVQRTENKQTVTYYYRATYEFAANDGGNELTQIKGYLTQADDFLIENQLPSIPIGIVDTTEPNFWLELLQSLIPILIVGLFAFIIIGKIANAQGGGKSTFDFGKSKARREDASTIRFSDVAGCEDEKEEMKEIVDYLKNPRKYAKSGARIPKGVILKGPPGTGKTLLAKAVAGEASVPFYYISGSDFLEMFVGVGASRVRDLFEEGKRHSPCIIFIDEIDAVARRRGTGMGGGHDEREQTLNQLLVEMDGFGVNEGIIVMAATNRVDILDPAILRPGRFDRTIAVGAPDVRGREEILKVHAKGKPLGDDVDLAQIAQTTAGFTGAELENLLNEAAILAAKEDRQFLCQKDIQKAFIKVGIGTEKHSRVISEKEKKITAYHEAGHAILFHVLEKMDPVYTISIIPTGAGAAGYTMPLPNRDEMFNTRGKMLENIEVCLGGRIAEELIFDDITTGASEDIRRATGIAKAMVTKYGMSANMGMVTYGDEQDEVFIGRDLAHSRGFSETTAAAIDREVKEIIDECYVKAKASIQAHSYVLEHCAQLLLEKEKIGREEFEALFPSEETEA